jgi:hypothetical protein
MSVEAVRGIGGIANSGTPPSLSEKGISLCLCETSVSLW